MKHNEWLVLWILALIATGIWVAGSYFSRGARLHRRRRKSHSRLVSKAKGPAVKFSVRAPKE